MGDRTPRDKRLRLIEAWRRSGLSQRAFAEEMGLNVNTFRAWIWRERQEAAEPKVEFLEVARPGGPSLEGGHLELQLPSGAVLSLGELPDVRWLADLDGALKAC